MLKAAVALNIFAFFLFAANSVILYLNDSDKFKYAASMAVFFLILSVFYGRKYRQGKK